LFSKALAGPADAISIDLEDSVSAGQKAQARDHVTTWLERLQAKPAIPHGKIVIVRVNAAETPYLEADLEACVRPGVHLINLPKPANAEEVREVSARITRLEQRAGLHAPIGLLLNIESPASLRQAADLAGADDRVRGLQLGLADLFEPAGIDRRERAAVEQAMFLTRLAAAEAGVYAYDAAYADIKDTEGFRAEALLARRMGFIGKSCIHPAQISMANECFQPSAQELNFARRVVIAAEAAEAQGQGVCVVDGKMVDAPFVLRARQLLAAHQASEEPRNE